MAEWIEKNKSFILSIIVVIVPVILIFGALRIQAEQNSSDILKTAARCKIEADRSQKVDLERVAQIVRIEVKLDNLECRSSEVQAAIEKTNDKLDWLIRQEVKGGAHAN